MYCQTWGCFGPWLSALVIHEELANLIGKKREQMLWNLCSKICMLAWWKESCHSVVEFDCVNIMPFIRKWGKVSQITAAVFQFSMNMLIWDLGVTYRGNPMSLPFMNMYHYVWITTFLEILFFSNRRNSVGCY